MATDIAKFLRKIRIDSDESLGDMADKIGLSAAYLSAIENNKRTAPEDMKENLYKAYSLSEEQKLEFARLVAESRKRSKLAFRVFRQNFFLNM